MPITGTPPPGWAEHFGPFTAFHLVVFVVAAGMIASACVLGVRWHKGPREHKLRFAWIGFTLLWQLYHIVWWLMPSQFDAAISFPLHVCDLAALIAPLALWTQWRPARTVLYFWGIGLSTQAFFTPTLSAGFGEIHFWFFWIGHLQIVGSAVYDTAVLGYRPRWRDLRLAYAVGLVYALTMALLDAAVGANYGYFGRSTPDAPTAIDLLGDWPLRIVWLVLVGLAAQTIAWAAWPISAAIRNRKPRTPTS